MIKTAKGEAVGTRVFLRIGDVSKVTGLPVSTIYYLVAKGEFPRSFRISPRCSAWDEADIAAWQRTKLAQRDAA